MGSQEDAYTIALQNFRQQKDDFFFQSEDSPLTREARASGIGLQYFPPDFSLRIVPQVELLANPQTIVMDTTDNDRREFIRFARFIFEIGERRVQLYGYRSANDHVHSGEAINVFIPFRDVLSGKETYGAGRYLDVEMEIDQNGNADVVLDFNLAYNPYCAYNTNYSCPLTPLENTLPVPIYAGEKIFHD